MKLRWIPEENIFEIYDIGTTEESITFPESQSKQSFNKEEVLTKITLATLSHHYIPIYLINKSPLRLKPHEVIQFALCYRNHSSASKNWDWNALFTETMDILAKAKDHNSLLKIAADTFNQICDPSSMPSTPQIPIIDIDDPEDIVDMPDSEDVTDQPENTAETETSFEPENLEEFLSRESVISQSSPKTSPRNSPTPEKMVPSNSNETIENKPPVKQKEADIPETSIEQDSATLTEETEIITSPITPPPKVSPTAEINTRNLHNDILLLDTITPEEIFSLPNYRIVAKFFSLLKQIAELTPGHPEYWGKIGLVKTVTPNILHCFARYHEHLLSHPKPKRGDLSRTNFSHLQKLLVNILVNENEQTVCKNIIENWLQPDESLPDPVDENEIAKAQQKHFLLRETYKQYLRRLVESKKNRNTLSPSSLPTAEPSKLLLPDTETFEDKTLLASTLDAKTKSLEAIEGILATTFDDCDDFWTSPDLFKRKSPQVRTPQNPLLTLPGTPSPLSLLEGGASFSLSQVSLLTGFSSPTTPSPISLASSAPISSPASSAGTPMSTSSSDDSVKQSIRSIKASATLRMPTAQFIDESHLEPNICATWKILFLGKITIVYGDHPHHTYLTTLLNSWEKHPESLTILLRHNNKYSYISEATTISATFQQIVKHFFHCHSSIESLPQSDSWEQLKNKYKELERKLIKVCTNPQLQPFLEDSQSDDEALSTYKQYLKTEAAKFSSTAVIALIPIAVTNEQRTVATETKASEQSNQTATLIVKKTTHDKPEDAALAFIVDCKFEPSLQMALHQLFRGEISVNPVAANASPKTTVTYNIEEYLQRWIKDPANSSESEEINPKHQINNAENQAAFGQIINCLANCHYATLKNSELKKTNEGKQLIRTLKSLEKQFLIALNNEEVLHAFRNYQEGLVPLYRTHLLDHESFQLTQRQEAAWKKLDEQETQLILNGQKVETSKPNFLFPFYSKTSEKPGGSKKIRKQRIKDIVDFLAVCYISRDKLYVGNGKHRKILPVWKNAYEKFRSFNDLFLQALRDHTELRAILYQYRQQPDTPFATASYIDWLKLDWQWEKKTIKRQKLFVSRPFMEQDKKLCDKYYGEFGFGNVGIVSEDETESKLQVTTKKTPFADTRHEHFNARSRLSIVHHAAQPPKLALESWEIIRLEDWLVRNYPLKKFYADRMKDTILDLSTAETTAWELIQSQTITLTTYSTDDNRPELHHIDGENSHALFPFYSSDTPESKEHNEAGPQDFEKRKARIIAIIKLLASCYHSLAKLIEGTGSQRKPLLTWEDAINKLCQRNLAVLDGLQRYPELRRILATYGTTKDLPIEVVKYLQYLERENSLFSLAIKRISKNLAPTSISSTKLTASSSETPKRESKEEEEEETIEIILTEDEPDTPQFSDSLIPLSDQLENLHSPARITTRSIKISIAAPRTISMEPFIVSRKPTPIPQSLTTATSLRLASPDTKKPTLETETPPLPDTKPIGTHSRPHSTSAADVASLCLGRSVSFNRRGGTVTQHYISRRHRNKPSDTVLYTWTNNSTSDIPAQTPDMESSNSSQATDPETTQNNDIRNTK